MKLLDNLLFNKDLTNLSISQYSQILFVEEGDPFEPEDSQIFPLAESFEQFLILAGNANQLAREIKEDDSNREEKEQEFINRMNILKVPEKYHKTWLRML